MTNQDLAAYGRKLEEERLGDRAVFLLHRIRVIEDDMKMKLTAVQALRKEYDVIQEKRGLASQTKLAFAQ